MGPQMPNRTEILRIRCSSETMRKFKRIAVDFDTYEDALNSVIPDDKKLTQWIEDMIKSGRFRNYGHVVEVALKLLREKEEARPAGAF